MRMTPLFRWIAVFIAIALAGGAAYLYTITNRTERAYVFLEPLSQYDFVESTEQLVAITVPEERDFIAITNPAEIVGKYLSQDVTANQLVQPSLLIDELPDGRRRFENGLLPIDVNGYPVTIAGDIASVFKKDDMVDIILLINSDGEPTEDDVIFPLFQKVVALEVVEGGSLVVGLTYQQIAVLEGFKSLEGVSFTAAINQSANSDLPPLHPFQTYPDLNDPAIRELFAVPTATPMPTPMPTEVPPTATPAPPNADEGADEGTEVDEGADEIGEGN